MACARVELLGITNDLPGEVLEWQPAPGEWSIEGVLRHVAAAERWYLTRILNSSTLTHFKPLKSIWARLDAVRALALERLAELSEAELSAVVADKSGELWSARKVFRRCLEHEREHTDHISKVLEQYAMNHNRDHL